MYIKSELNQYYIAAELNHIKLALNCSLSHCVITNASELFLISHHRPDTYLAVREAKTHTLCKETKMKMEHFNFKERYIRERV